MDCLDSLRVVFQHAFGIGVLDNETAYRIVNHSSGFLESVHETDLDAHVPIKSRR